MSSPAPDPLPALLTDEQRQQRDLKLREKWDNDFLRSHRHSEKEYFEYRPNGKDHWEEPWRTRFRFEEGWYLMANVVGFRHMPIFRDDTKDGYEFPDWETEFQKALFEKMSEEEKLKHFPKYVCFKYRKHQVGMEVMRHFQLVFTDENDRLEHIAFQKRDRSIPIKGPEVCARCRVKGTEENPLHRDHILALDYGGKDTTSNLQWLCRKCHMFKTTEERILHELEKFRKMAVGVCPQWRINMWERRLEVLRERNPVEAEGYRSYLPERTCEYEYWYERPTQKRKSVERQMEQGAQATLA